MNIFRDHNTITSQKLIASVVIHTQLFEQFKKEVWLKVKFKQCVTCGMTGFNAVTQSIIVFVVRVECHKLIAVAYELTL